MAQTEAKQSASENGSPTEKEQIAPGQQVPHRLEDPPPSTESDSDRARHSRSRTCTEDHRCGIGRRRRARCDPESSQDKAAAKDPTATSLVLSRRADLQTAQARSGEKRSAA